MSLLKQHCILVICFAVLGGYLPTSGFTASDELNEIQQWIVDEHPRVSHIDAEQLNRQSNRNDFVVFDVRQQEEFEVSHLLNSIRIDPDISRQDFLNQYSDVLENKNVVFYCSVGRRSSLLAEKVSDDLLEQGSISIVNLENGIFGWHNDRRPLVSQNQSTDYVHPYSRRWRRLIERKEMIRFSLE